MKHPTVKLFFPLMITLLCSYIVHAQSNLGAGDIAFTGYRAEPLSNFSFLTLAEIENGTTVLFTDNGWKSDNTFRTGEGILTISFTADVACGTELHVVPASGNVTGSSGIVGSISASGTFSLSTSGDQILAYQGNTNSPTFISAVNFNGNNPWDADATNDNTSAIPTGLQNGGNAVGHNEVDNGRYECFNTISGTIASLRSAINNTRNWTKSDQGSIIPVPSGCNFSISDCGGSNCAPANAVCNNTSVQLDAGGAASIMPSAVGGGSTAACGLMSESVNPMSFDCQNVGSPVSVTYTITDTNGASSSCTASVTVEDNIAPTAGCMNVMVQLDANGHGSATAASVESGSSDNCGNVIVQSLVPNIFDCGNIGPNTVTLTVNDGNGNTSTCTATATVEDKLNPTAFCPPNKTFNTDPGLCTAVGTGDLTSTASDNCPDPTITYILSGATTGSGDIGPLGETFNLGVTTVNVTVTDAAGNTGNCSFDVTVEDNEAPIAICKTTTVEIQPDGLYMLQEADVYDANASTDNCSINNVSFAATTYDCNDKDQMFNVGVMITDASGNTASCNANISVIVGNALPDGWDFASIGSPGTLGNFASFDPCSGSTPAVSDFTVAGGGNNATSTMQDNVSYISQSICGNGTVTAKVESVSPNGYGGLMIREFTASTAKQVAVFSNLTSALRHEVRYATNTPKQVSNFFKPSPIWLRLERTGDWFFAYYSTDGTNFQYLHAVMVPMQSCIEFGLAAFTYLPAQQTEAVFSNVTVTGMPNPAGVSIEIVEAPSIQLKPSLYPNPAKSIVNLLFEDVLHTNVTLSLRNQLGQVIEQRELRAGDFTSEWDVSTLIDGLYLFEIRQENGEVEVLRLVKTQ